MHQTIHEEMVKELEGFELPAYNEIPDIGLFLEQAAKYIVEYLKPLEGVTITGSMISNYVKKKIIKNPVKKQYGREQIAYLFFIAVAKNVISLENIQALLELQRETYDIETAYNYFRNELTNVLQYVFGMRDKLDEYTPRNPDEKALVRNTVITMANKVYLDMYFKKIRG